jgi:hypothetical protein
MKLSRCALLVLVVFVLIPCFAHAAVVGVRMGSFFFNPTNVVINPGDRVIWTNTTAQAHDSTSPGLWASGNVTSNATFGFTFTNAGYYPYRCQQHLIQGPQQTGTVSVVRISLANTVRTATNVQFEIRGGRNGLRAVVEAGNSLGVATPVRTNTFPTNGIINFSEGSATLPLPPTRYYRTRVIP